LRKESPKWGEGGGRLVCGVESVLYCAAVVGQWGSDRSGVRALLAESNVTDESW